MREFVMGTKDGSRNFSANCDLKRSMSSDRCWPQQRKPREQCQLQPQPEGAAGTGAGPRHSPSPLAHSLLLHTPGRKEEKGKLFLIVQPSGCKRDHKKDGGQADIQGRSRVQGRCLRRGGDFESAPRTAATAGLTWLPWPRPCELIFGERAEEIRDSGKGGGGGGSSLNLFLPEPKSDCTLSP